MRRFLDGMIVVAALGFIAILALAAVFDRTILWLHVFQALMYVAVIGLIAARNRWAYFIGLSIAALWNYMAMFVNSFFGNGLRALQESIAAGKLVHADQIISVAAVTFHFMMIVGSLILIVQTSRRAAPELARLLVAFAVFTGYFAASMALFQPRYLPQFARILHPHGLF
jgi:hypothetical protein